MQILLDPDANLDVAFDWSAWLTDTEAISTYTVTATTGVTVTTPAPSESAGIVTAWLGSGTAGTLATVTCHITTDAGRADDRSITVRVRER